MAHREIQEERANHQAGGTSETEKQFLKDLYNYMKKRDTPIERIPNLGFKQSNNIIGFSTFFFELAVKYNSFNLTQLAILIF